NRATVVTSVEKPASAQPVHGGGLQSRPNSASLQNLTTGELSTAGYAGTGSFPHGGCGPVCAFPCIWQRIITENANRIMVVITGASWKQRAKPSGPRP